jgi:hypothetical protein
MSWRVAILRILAEYAIDPSMTEVPSNEMWMWKDL